MTFPVFIINGFLDSGKTTFIIDTVKSDEFYKQGSTLLLVCEEGEIEYKDELSKYRVHVEYFESVNDFNAERLDKLTNEYRPDRIIIETNMMWDQKLMTFPSYFQVGQIVSFIDFTTFPVYYNNMRQKFVDSLRFSDLIVFNRCDNVLDLAPYQTSLKLINSNASVVAMNHNFEVCEAFEQPLPFDINSDIIKVSDEDYARWYIDTFDHKERYVGKKVEFNGIVIKSKKLPKDSIIIGRYAMTCCAKDIQLYGHLCKIGTELKLKSKSWLHVVCEVRYEYSEEYEEEETVLYPIKVEKISEIKDPVLNLV